MPPQMIIAGSILYFFASTVVGLAGRKRKFGGWGYFFASIAFSPLIGLLLVLASDLRPEFRRQD